MRYAQLTREQRDQIYALMKAGQNQTRIAVIIGCHKSTIAREVRRNRGGRGYRPKQADELAQARKLAAHQPRIEPETWARVESLLRQEWSPEQITGRLKLERQPHRQPPTQLPAHRRGQAARWHVASVLALPRTAAQTLPQ